MKRFLRAAALLIVFGTILFFAMSIREKKMDNLKIYDVLLWRDTPVKELADAVYDQDADLIKSLSVGHPDWMDYQEPRFGCTLLIWSVGTERYTSAGALLEAGADPDLRRYSSGTTALYLASGYSWVDNRWKKDPKFVTLLLRYRADPNICVSEDAPLDGIPPGTSPLMASIGCGIEKTKALVDGGADINHENIKGETAASEALGWGLGRWAGRTEMIAYAHYLIVEQKAVVNKNAGTDLPPSLSPTDKLRRWIYPLDSEEFRVKMEIVEECARQGVDYWSTEIDGFQLSLIQKEYPDTWEEYILVY